VNCTPFRRGGQRDAAGAWCDRYEAERATYTVLSRVAPGSVGTLVRDMGAAVRKGQVRASLADEEGWVLVELTFESLWEARARLLGMGRAVEVLEPEPLRLSMVDYARQIVDLYETGSRRG